MKRNFQIRGFIAGVIVTCMLFTVAFAAPITKTINVTFNSVNLAVNGNKVNAETILYNGTTYVPLRATAEMLGKEVGWNQKTNTASINDKQIAPTVPPTPAQTPAPVTSTVNSGALTYGTGTKLFLMTKINGDLYGIDLPGRIAVYDEKNNKLYFEQGICGIILALNNNKYNITPEKSNNPLIKGYIHANTEDYINNVGSQIYYYNSDHTKSYIINTKENQGGFAYGPDFLIPAENFVDALGITLEIIPDTVNKQLIISIK